MARTTVTAGENTNLGRVGHIVPVWCRKFKLAPQNLLKERLLVFTAPVDNYSKICLYVIKM